MEKSDKELYRFGPYAGFRQAHRMQALESFGIKKEQIDSIDKHMRETCGIRGKKFSVHGCFESETNQEETAAA